MVVMLGVNFPFIFSIFAPKIFGENLYSNGLIGYTSNAWNMHQQFKEIGISRMLGLDTVPLSLLENKMGMYILSSFILFSIFLFFYKKKDIYFDKILGGIIVMIFFIKISPFLLDPETFGLLTNKLIPFLSSEVRWIDILFVPIFSLLIVRNIILIDLKKYKRAYIGVLFGVLFLSMVPFFTGNQKLQLLSISSIPKDVQSYFFSKSIQSEGSYFFPSEGNVLTSYLPYPLPFAYNSHYLELFSSNSRYVNQKQVSMRNFMNNVDEHTTGFIHNLRILNLKSLFFFKNIHENEGSKFDYGPATGYVQKTKNIENSLLYLENTYIRNKSENFTHFGLKDDDKYEFSLYAPASIIQKDISSFFSGSIDIYKKPLNIDPTAFQKPIDIENFIIPPENQNILIRYKHSDLQSTKIYAQITNFDSRKPFLLQLNQTFGTSWKIKWITKDEFEGKVCISPYREFPITQNKVCQFAPRFFDIGDIKYLGSPTVSDKSHFEGNFVGNAWMINPDDIPSQMKQESEIYAVIIYEKQIYYTIALMVSGFTFLMLFLLSLLDVYRKFQKPKNNNL